MKATITAAGVLLITSETELESYALSNWGKENYNADRVIDGTKILFDVSVGADSWLKSQIKEQ